MRLPGNMWIMVAALALSGCEQKAPVAAGAREQPQPEQAVTQQTMPDPVLETGSLPDGILSGEELFIACVACHSLEEGQDHRVGPNLFGIDGQAAASRPGYSYSEALQQSGIIWNAGSLMAWIMQAEGMVPGTWMAYANYLEAAEVQRLADYILKQSQFSQSMAPQGAVLESTGKPE